MNSEDVIRVNLAAVQVWGKGFRVSVDSEEFQPLVPRVNSAEVPIEGCLARVAWGPILESLYNLNDRELSLQRAVLIFDSDVLVIAFARTEDRHGRPSMVMITVTTSIDWNAPSLASIVSRSVALSMRLAREYARAFNGNPQTIEGQLTTGVFLRDRWFDLGGEQEDIGADWGRILSAVQKFRGISGVATARLLSCGANVLLGTRHEAERAVLQNGGVDGFYDVRTRSIVPLTARLSPWVPAITKPELEVAPPALAMPDGGDARRVVESLDRIEQTLQLIADAVLRLLHLKSGRRKK